MGSRRRRRCRHVEARALHQTPGRADPRTARRDDPTQPEDPSGVRGRATGRTVSLGRRCSGSTPGPYSPIGDVMKQLIALFFALLTAGTVTFAHGNNDHVRGVVTQVSATSVTVEVSPQVTKTLTLNDKTTFERSGKSAKLADLKVGDRVIVDVPKGTTEASSIKFGAPSVKKTT